LKVYFLTAFFILLYFVLGNQKISLSAVFIINLILRLIKILYSKTMLIEELEAN